MANVLGRSLIKRVPTHNCISYPEYWIYLRHHDDGTHWVETTLDKLNFHGSVLLTTEDLGYMYQSACNSDGKYSPEYTTINIEEGGSFEICHCGLKFTDSKGRVVEVELTREQLVALGALV